MKKRLLSCLILAALLLPAIAIATASCGKPATVPVSASDSGTSPDDAVTDTADDDANTVVFAKAGETTDFQLVYNVEVGSEERNAILSIRTTLQDELGVSLKPVDDAVAKFEVPCEIVVNSQKRPDCKALMDSLSEGEYAIRVVKTDEKTKILIAYKGAYARMTVIDKFLKMALDVPGGRAAIPADTDLRDNQLAAKFPLDSGIASLRDPCVLLVDDTYYVFGTGWVCYYSKSLTGPWKGPVSVVRSPAEADNNYWAPEVHVYQGAYYMFTTYHSSKTGHRGCTILKADNPLGPFVEITDGQITPHNWDCIDGTFYVDEEGQPWMVFVHEWTSLSDGVGRMACAKLSPDLTHFISEPVELFRADSPKWTSHNVTDGCYMYRTAVGSLLMIWSNFEKGGYAVGIARSTTGLVTGPWVHEDKLLFSKGMTGQYDGGHGMIFKDTTGQLYMSIHSPNTATASRGCMPVFVPIKEKNDTLVWDLGD